MSRIYLTLAGLALAMMLVTLGVGLSLGDLKPQLERLQELNEELAAESLESDNPGSAAKGTSEQQREMASLEAVGRRANMHRLLGIGSGIMVMLVNCIAVTYFVGTSRWCREVVEAYQLDGRLWGQSASMKRRTFFWALVGMLTILVISSLGALSDPMAAFDNSQQYITPHFLAAMIGLGIVGWSFIAQWSHITENHEIIALILVEVQQIREERGLESSV